MEDEHYILTRTSLIFVPDDMKHCPLILRRVDRPIIHFTTVPDGQYIKDEDRVTGGQTSIFEVL